ncbi:hypothetical protein JCM6882_007556 [Rhodosporidiobolus microsporus]
MASVAAIQQQLLELLSSLPPDTNPYLALSSFLKAQLFPAVGESASIQLYVIAALLGITTLLVLVSLGLRWKKGIFWVARVQDSPRLVRPHATISWALVAVVMLVFFEVLVSRELKFFNKEVDRNFAFWILLVWGISWVGGHVAAWSLGVSFLLHLHATNPDFAMQRYASFANIAGFGAPVVYAAVLLPLGILGGIHYRNALDLFKQIDDLLLAGARTWTPGTSFNILSLTPGLPILEEMQKEIDSFSRWFRATFIFYAVTAAFLVLYLVVIAVLHLSSLRRMLKATAHELSSSNNFKPDARAPRYRDHQQKRVHRTLQSLAITIAAFSFLGLFFCAIAITSAISPLSLITSPSRSQAVAIGPLWTFAVFGLPCAVLLVVRARDSLPKEDSRALHPASGAKNSRSGSGEKGGMQGVGSPRAVVAGLPPNAGESFSIQLSPLWDSPAQFDGGREEGEAKQLRVGEELGWGRWLGLSGGRHEHEQRTSTVGDFGASVSVQVDVDVSVEKDDETMDPVMEGEQRNAAFRGV